MSAKGEACVGARGSSEASGAGAVRVRDGTPADMPHIHRMIHELAAFEGVPDGPKLSVRDLIEDAFESSPPWFFVLVAEMTSGTGGEESGAGGELAGYALCNRAYSSWTRRAYYVEDLYVRPELRGRGVGTELLARLCQMGVSEGVHRMDWHVLVSNKAARGFYAVLGARCLRETEGRAALRLDSEHIARLAARAPPAPPAPHAFSDAAASATTSI